MRYNTETVKNTDPEYILVEALKDIQINIQTEHCYIKAMQRIKGKVMHLKSSSNILGKIHLQTQTLALLRKSLAIYVKELDNVQQWTPH